MITDIDDFFARGCGRCARFATPDCSTRQWLHGLTDLRRICLAAGLVETVKWAHPCYTHAHRNIAIIGAVRSDYRLSFMNAALMKDPHGVLERPGPNTVHPDMIRFTSNAQAAEMEAIVVAYLKEAMGYAETGAKAIKPARVIELPQELAAAMDTDRALAEAFHRLTPGRQRSYVINLNAAKTAATRVSRIARFRAHILAGKGATER